ncbi:MAG: ATP-binding protein [Saprospiraceae bacterium]|nr:ATP-binding protein [Saprospiraceae bacterium]
MELNQLSTGEQHAIIMFYALLFEVPNESLILIDEPENSLHIEWQMEFLNDMKDIIDLRGFDVLIATHSPSIINGEWDLTVSLKGIEEAEYA